MSNKGLTKSKGNKKYQQALIYIYIFFLSGIKALCISKIIDTLIITFKGLHTRITVHAQTAAQQQSIENFEARMSEKSGEWRD